MHPDPLRPMSGFTRRTTLGRAAALATALTLGQRLGVTAQDATPAATSFPLADHPIIGVWQIDDSPEDPGKNIVWGFFGVDGSFRKAEVWTPRVHVGEWRATGERTAELVFVMQYVRPQDLFDPNQVVTEIDFEPNSERWQVSNVLDETRSTMTLAGHYEAFSAGTSFGDVAYEGTGTRMVVVPTAGTATPTS
jgi:hypothetical protein